MLDYKLMEALATIMECGGFECAGETLPTLETASPRLRIALNADSLATWWAATIGG
jgi:hypothetical protein